MNRLYPIGSVVKLELDTDKMVMIIGYYPIYNETKQLYQYLAVPYPGGISNDYSFQVFNHEDIKESLFTGYLSGEGEAIMNTLPSLEKEIVRQMKEAEKDLI
ncbi:MAG: DUF4176 domain-containing protein [Clostridium sp.]|nr:DUF4176 domain-containing protein [Clostridium sp.]